MQGPLNRKVLVFLLLDAVILMGVIGVFAAVNHAFAPSGPPLSERIFRTPEPTPSPQSTSAKTNEKTAAPSKGVAVIPQTLKTNAVAPEPVYVIAAEGELVDVARLLSKKVKVTPHEIKMKENYWLVAKESNIDLHTLIGANPGLPFKASIHQTLNILSHKGVLHTAAKGEKLAQIAESYRTDVKTLKEWNSISWWHGLREGDVLFIPDVKPLRMTKEWRGYYGQRGMFGVPFKAWGQGWTSSFGLRTDPITGESKVHKGMDFKAKYGDEVYAAGTGRVIFAGVSGGYGNLIQIAHADKYLTYYGHLSKIYVKTGQRVKRGTLIGRVGATGRVTGPHLHFEIRKNGKAINPLPLI